MNPDDFPSVDADVETVTPETVKSRIDANEDVFLLDARAPGDYEEWRIDGETVTSVNVPYFEFLEDTPDLGDVPEDETVTVVCAKGGASEFVAGKLKNAGYDVEHVERGMQGWAGVYEYEELDVDADATVAQYRRPSSGCLAYLVVSDGEAAVVDPLRAFADEYEQDARMLGAELTYALDTHIHADHVSGVRDVADATDATAVLPEAADARGVDYDTPYETVEHGDEITVGDATIDVIHTPGHTTGMTTYRVGDVLFTGDGLFTESVARPDLEDPEAAKDAARTLYDSLHERVLTHDDAVVAPAHFGDGATTADDGTYTAELGDVVDSMDALSMERESFVEFIVSDMPPQPANHEEIIATNLGHEAPSDDEAFELELGPNNCAASQEALTE
ncbi:MBL fold metallo-hydrolase [Halobacterium litoreum]|uniref:MBL fold metallo-hydrolase n=1 Tax=Halobacterium litoreum TaxID=2039234 RepID=A0ABD5NFA0_9EURY|nr:MBL fold metallo-hydrolase [Halobacterium litoreum]UHH13217.1 MBL fold metallo-hydrolase [Halobacterium litoreum]